jgi:hypothetical protein
VPERVSPADVPACEGANANPDTNGCDPVPTGIVEHDGLLYVSTLGAEVPGAARVYVLDQDGDVVDVIEGLTSASGVEVDRRGRVYVSNVIEGAPEGEGPPPAGFNPGDVGVLTRIDRDGTRYEADVTMPTGLLFHHGRLYASAWSVAAFLPGLAESLGLPAGTPLGQVVRVDRDAFHPAAATPTESSSAGSTDTSSASPSTSSPASSTATATVTTTTATTTTATSTGG